MTLLDEPGLARTLLSDCPQHELRRLVITETEDAIILEGRVKTFYMKQLAQETVKPAAEGRRLLNLIAVDEG
jgi:hypothetical protein